MPDKHKSAAELSRHGNECLRKKLYWEAEKSFLEAHRVDPRNAYALVGLGNLYCAVRNYGQAHIFYQKMLDIDPANPFSLKGMGDAFRGMQETEKSIPYWLRYLEHKRDDIHVMVRLADAYMKENLPGDAEKFCDMALKVGGLDKHALLGVGRLYYKAGMEVKALGCFKSLLEFDPEDVAVLNMAGDIHQVRGEYDEAIVCYEKALEYDPKNSISQYGLGNCQRGLKNPSEGLGWWLQVLEREPGNQQLRTRVADALANMGKLDEAAVHYQMSIDLGHDLYAWLGMSRVYLAHKEYDQAEACCRKILSESPDHERAREALAEILEAKGK
jgi:tetratricopeptide (TPR) repeat protein